MKAFYSLIALALLSILIEACPAWLTICLATAGVLALCGSLFSWGPHQTEMTVATDTEAEADRLAAGFERFRKALND